mmetsp:Transcript_73390/g.215224  ORF Transcript_73390/g.215224 Transcript_73390/m.215224 type:complete len:239 (+) Transcript_73390:80-796(+)
MRPFPSHSCPGPPSYSMSISKVSMRDSAPTMPGVYMNLWSPTMTDSPSWTPTADNFSVMPVALQTRLKRSWASSKFQLVLAAISSTCGCFMRHDSSSTSHSTFGSYRPFFSCRPFGSSTSSSTGSPFATSLTPSPSCTRIRRSTMYSASSLGGPSGPQSSLTIDLCHFQTRRMHSSTWYREATEMSKTRLWPARCLRAFMSSGRSSRASGMSHLLTRMTWGLDATDELYWRSSCMMES